MSADKANAYMRTKVMTASPAELRLLLIEGAIKFSRQGRDGLASKDYEASFNGLTQAKSIILELINGLRPEVDPELCTRLSSLYTFLYRRLIDAGLEKSPDIVDEVISLLEYDRETWMMLMNQLAKSPSNGDAGHPAAGERAYDAERARTPLSVEG